MLAAVLMLLPVIPSFALAGADEGGQPSAGAAVQTEEAVLQADNAGTNEETAASAASAEESVSGAADSTDSTGAEADADAEDRPEAEPAAGIKAAPLKVKAAAPKAASVMPENNDKVKYTSAGSHPVKFTVKHDGYTFKGTCATLGVENAKSGTATVKRISNNSRIARLVYYYGYKKGWWVGKNSDKKATTVLDFTDKDCTENAKQCIEALIQRSNMGWSDFWDARKNGKYRMYSTDSFMREINSLYNKDISDITIPDDVEFEIFHGETSSKNQDFYVWRYKKIPDRPEGYVAVEKLSADESITY